MFPQVGGNVLAEVRWMKLSVHLCRKARGVSMGLGPSTFSLFFCVGIGKIRVSLNNAAYLGPSSLFASSLHA